MKQIKQFASTRKGKGFFVGLTLLFCFGVGASVFASQIKQRPGYWLMKRMVSKLNLTNEQKARLRIVYRDAKQDRAANKKTFTSLRAKMKGLLSHEKPSQQELNNLIRQGFDNAKRIALSKSKYILQVHEILTPTQRQLIQKSTETFQKRFQKRHERFNNPHFVPEFLK